MMLLYQFNCISVHCFSLKKKSKQPTRPYIFRSSYSSICNIAMHKCRSFKAHLVSPTESKALWEILSLSLILWNIDLASLWMRERSKAEKQKPQRKKGGSSTELSIADGRISKWHSVMRQHLHQSLWTRLHLWPSAMGAVVPAALAPGPGRAMPTWSGCAPEHMANKSTLKWCLKYINSCDRGCYTHTYTENWGVKPFGEGTRYWYLLFEHMCAIMIKVENACHNGLWVLVTVTQLFNNRSHYAREASQIIGNDDGLLIEYKTKRILAEIVVFQYFLQKYFENDRTLKWLKCRSHFLYYWLLEIPNGSIVCALWQMWFMDTFAWQKRTKKHIQRTMLSKESAFTPVKKKTV